MSWRPALPQMLVYMLCPETKLISVHRNMIGQTILILDDYSTTAGPNMVMQNDYRIFNVFGKAHLEVQ